MVVTGLPNPDDLPPEELERMAKEFWRLLSQRGSDGAECKDPEMSALLAEYHRMKKTDGIPAARQFLKTKTEELRRKRAEQSCDSQHTATHYE